ncbi:hypothetical protein MVEG_11763 [Podila verticillata NRRL 6337]|uniref:Uncharacterized protein n=1 Tax=Podila verticillata NRRL 6337 TaxID=1069443 RepID=A0A086TJJ7_9FUNG|nr:hypothetical protein MVEG_11763 [Podila verticillata NRRL 6337]
MTSVAIEPHTLLCSSIDHPAVSVAAQEAYNYDALFSRAHFVGKDTSDPRTSGLRIFKDPSNHPTAVASILVHIASDVDFKPQDGVVLNQQVYSKFETRISKVSALQRVDSNYHVLDLTGDLEQLACEVSKKLDPVNAYKVADTFRRLVPSSVKGVWWRDFLLTQVVIHKAADSNNITVELASLGLTLSQNSKGRAVVDQQKATLSQKLFKVNAEDFVTKAQEWSDSILMYNVGDYLLKLTSEGDFTSSSSEDPGSLCPPLFPKLPEFELPTLPEFEFPNIFGAIGGFFGAIWNFIVSIPGTLGSSFHCVIWVLLYVLGGALVGTAVTVVCGLFFLLLIGFGPAGIIAGSIAALWMATYAGFVPAGCLLAILQAAGALGACGLFPVAGIIGVVVGGGYGGYVAVVTDGVCDTMYTYL